jgi:hypothetical protein
MPNPEWCRERADACRRKAQATSNVRDRAHWLKLADDWIALGEIPFQTSLPQGREENPLAGLWRGDSRSSAP